MSAISCKIPPNCQFQDQLIQKAPFHSGSICGTRSIDRSRLPESCETENITTFDENFVTESLFAFEYAATEISDGYRQNKKTLQNDNETVTDKETG
ncbi:MAG: hypothetical protein LBH60_05560 [Prevotellaceae bacterium]|jgi:hypothetical protein|nr:hypothetical protein [Prevotellaceae bacterium]